MSTLKLFEDTFLPIDASFFKADTNTEKNIVAQQQMEARVQSLVASSVLKETHHNYRPVSKF